MYTLQMVCQVLAPSILAASARAFGMDLKCCLSRKIARALPKNGSMMPTFVSVSPRSARVIKLGVMRTSFGMMICMKITANTRVCPLKSMTASA